MESARVRNFRTSWLISEIERARLCERVSDYVYCVHTEI